jgi:hypothetical protein
MRDDKNSKKEEYTFKLNSHKSNLEGLNFQFDQILHPGNTLIFFEIKRFDFEEFIH